MKRFTFVFIFFMLIFSYDISAQATHLITLQSNQPPQLFADAGVDTSLTTMGTYILGGIPAGAGGTPPFQYQWSPATYLNTDTVANPVFTHDGSYPYVEFYLTVTDDRNCRATDSVMVTLLYYSIEEIAKPILRVYPIPATSYLAIELPGPGGEVSLYSLDGKLIVKQSVDNELTMLAVDKIPRGVYLLSYSKEELKQTMKVILK